MKIGGFLFTALVGVAAVLDQASAVDMNGPENQGYLPGTVQPPKEPEVCEWNEKRIDHSEVKSFPQPVAETPIEKAAINFKPLLHVRDGCHPYPAVDKDGQTSGGLKPTGTQYSGCKGSGHGSQVYGRSRWFKGYWTTVYSYYFPKDKTFVRVTGARHSWESVVVFLNNGAVEHPKIEAVSVSSEHGFLAQVPPSAKTLSDTHVKVRYVADWSGGKHALEFASEEGKEYDLIMWQNLTHAARCALNNTKWNDKGGLRMPLADGEFENTLERAYPPSLPERK